MTLPIAEYLVRGALDLAIPVSDEVIADLSRFAELLLRWNRSINLVARGTNAERLVERHLLDSLALLRLLPERGHVVDIGAGAGFPSLPLHIAGGTTTSLVEPSGRRCSFQRAVVRELKLSGVEVHEARQEKLQPGKDLSLAEVVVSRATFAPIDWIPIGERWLPAGGALVVMTSQDDVEALEGAARERGLALEKKDVFTLPKSGARRENLLFRRS